MAKFYIAFSVIMVCLFATYGVLKYLFSSKKFEDKISQEKRDKFNNVINKILKVSVICYCVLMFLCIFLPDAFALCYGKEELLLSSKEVGFAIIRWFSALSFIMLPLAVFFKNRSIRNIAIYFCSIMTLVSIIFYPTFNSLSITLQQQAEDSIVFQFSAKTLKTF